MWFVNFPCLSNLFFFSIHTGADGTIGFWDKDARIRLKSTGFFFLFCTVILFIDAIAFDAAPGPISASDFSRDGSIFAYSVTYDWHKGHGGMTPGHPNKIMLHGCKDEEVKKRPVKR
jgi:mRNA export factor